MAIQYSISYDNKGNPSLVKNTIEGSKPVVKTSFNIGEYKPVRTIQTNFDFDNKSGKIDANYTILSIMAIEIWCQKFLIN